MSSNNPEDKNLVKPVDPSPEAMREYIKSLEQEIEELEARVAEKKQPEERKVRCRIKFKSMQQILSQGNTHFDYYGNLVGLKEHGSDRDGHLPPTCFKMLGREVDFDHDVSFPFWCIDEMWMRDAFYMVKALENIARTTKDEDVKELAEAGLSQKLIVRLG